MEKQSQYVGKIIDQYQWTIGEDAPRKYARATMQPAKLGQKFGDKIFSNYYSATIQLAGSFAALKIDETKIMHTKECVEIFVEPRPGKNITVFALCKNLFEQQGQNCPIGFAELQFFGRKGKTPYFLVERVLAIRGGFKR